MHCITFLCITFYGNTCNNCVQECNMLPSILIKKDHISFHQQEKQRWRQRHSDVPASELPTVTPGTKARRRQTQAEQEDQHPCTGGVWSPAYESVSEEGPPGGNRRGAPQIGGPLHHHPGRLSVCQAHQGEFLTNKNWNNRKIEND